MRGSRRYPAVGVPRRGLRGRLGASDQPGDGSQPRDGLGYGQHRAIQKKGHTSRRARPILGPKIHMPQIVTSKGAIRGHTAELGQFTPSAASPQQRAGNIGPPAR